MIVPARIKAARNTLPPSPTPRRTPRKREPHVTQPAPKLPLVEEFLNDCLKAALERSKEYAMEDAELKYGPFSVHWVGDVSDVLMERLFPGMPPKYYKIIQESAILNNGYKFKEEEVIQDLILCSPVIKDLPEGLIDEILSHRNMSDEEYGEIRKEVHRSFPRFSRKVADEGIFSAYEDHADLFGVG